MTDFVYILAASHSGSTLLTMLLNSHPDIVTVGELAPGHMEDLAWYQCSCGAKLRECGFWRHIQDATDRRGLAFQLEDFGTRFTMPDSGIASRLLKPLHRGPAMEFIRDVGLRLLTPWAKRFKRISRANEILIEQILDYYGSKVFVDKGNRAIRLKYLLRIPSLNIKVIRLIRDGRAVALTYMDPANYADAEDESLRGGGNGGDRADECLTIASAAYQWRRCNEEAEHVLACVTASRTIEIRYEELCCDTDATLDRIFDFLGLDPTRRLRDFRSAEHHILGNGMRLDSAAEIRLDERWKSQLTLEDLHTFDAVAGRLNYRYGYAPEVIDSEAAEHTDPLAISP